MDKNLFYQKNNMQYQRSSALFQAAKKVIPGGVNSPVRAFQSVGGDPIFIEKAKGAYLIDARQIIKNQPLLYQLLI